MKGSEEKDWRGKKKQLMNYFNIVFVLQFFSLLSLTWQPCWSLTDPNQCLCCFHFHLHLLPTSPGSELLSLKC